MLSLEEKIKELIGDIAEFRSRCAVWWSANQAAKNTLLGLSIFFTLGTTIAGASGLKDQFKEVAGPLAAIFGALSGTVIAVQSSFKFAEKAAYYAQAITDCDAITQKLKFKVESDASFDTFLESFLTLRYREAAIFSPTVKNASSGSTAEIEKPGAS